MRIMYQSTPSVVGYPSLTRWARVVQRTRLPASQFTASSSNSTKGRSTFSAAAKSRLFGSPHVPIGRARGEPNNPNETKAQERLPARNARSSWEPPLVCVCTWSICLRVVYALPLELPLRVVKAAGGVPRHELVHHIHRDHALVLARHRRTRRGWRGRLPHPGPNPSPGPGAVAVAAVLVLVLVLRQSAAGAGRPKVPLDALEQPGAEGVRGLRAEPRHERGGPCLAACYRLPPKKPMGGGQLGQLGFVCSSACTMHTPCGPYGCPAAVLACDGIKTTTHALFTYPAARYLRAKESRELPLYIPCCAVLACEGIKRATHPLSHALLRGACV